MAATHISVTRKPRDKNSRMTSLVKTAILWCTKKVKIIKEIQVNKFRPLNTLNKHFNVFHFLYFRGTSITH